MEVEVTRDHAKVVVAFKQPGRDEPVPLASAIPGRRYEALAALLRLAPLGSSARLEGTDQIVVQFSRISAARAAVPLIEEVAAGFLA